MKHQEVTKVVTATIECLRKKGLTNLQVGRVLYEAGGCLMFRPSLPLEVCMEMVLRPPPPPSPPPKAEDLPADHIKVAHEVITLIGGARKIQCIKAVREKVGCGLKEAKEAVEAVLAAAG